MKAIKKATGQGPAAFYKLKLWTKKPKSTC